MRKRPIDLSLTVGYLVLFPPLAVLFIHFFLEVPWSDVGEALEGPGLLYLAAIYVVAFGIYNVKIWGYYLFLVFSILIAGFDIYHALTSTGGTNFWFLFDLVLLLFSAFIFSRRNLIEPYFNPSIRWWERPGRIRIDVPALIRVAGSEVSTQILDISHSGCFADFEPRPVPGQKIEIEIVYASNNFLSPAVVVRHSENPKGIGIKFLALDAAKNETLIKIIKCLEESSRADSSLQTT